MDPILDAATPHVAPLTAFTQPMETTIVDTYSYFHSVQPNCATIRTDGKRITFHNHYHKTDIQEDITYLKECIRKDPHGPFKEVTGVEIEQAEAILDPVAAMKKRLRAEVLAELAAEGLIPAGNVPTNPPVVVDPTAIDQLQAALHGEVLLAGVDAASAARAKLAQMKAGAGVSTGAVHVSPLTGSAVPLLTPVSTSDIAGAASGSNSGGASLSPVA